MCGITVESMSVGGVYVDALSTDIDGRGRMAAFDVNLTCIHRDGDRHGCG